MYSNVMCSCNMLAIPYVQGNWFIILIGVYFRRLKINHDSHEFILESGTIANIYVEQIHPAIISSSWVMDES
jgi:hypothetical protein